MTKPQEPKRVHIDSICAGIPSGEFMLAEEAIAYAEAVRQEALDEACKIVNDRAELVKVHLGLQSASDLNRLAGAIRKLKEGK